MWQYTKAIYTLGPKFLAQNGKATNRRSAKKNDFEPAPRKLSTSPLRWSYNNLQKTANKIKTNTNPSSSYSSSPSMNPRSNLSRSISST